MSVDLVRGLGRPGAVPTLELTYRSDGRNGPFGWGWSLSVPAVRRGTGRYLPRYRDAGERPDGYTATDLGELIPTTDGPEVVEGVERCRFRPRVEGTYMLVERLRATATGDLSWRITGHDGHIREFGSSAAARLADPAERSRVAAWLLERESSRLGHEVAWEYKSDGAEVYPKRMRWGNTIPGQPGGWLFEIVFDYGDHDAYHPAPGEDHPWTTRQDAFSSHRAGFEVRTSRLCRRILVFSSLGGSPTLVRVYELGYDESRSVSRLVSVRLRGIGQDGAEAALPVLRLEYTAAAGPGPVRQVAVDGVPLPTVTRLDWLDIDGTGLPDLVRRDPDGGLSRHQNLGAARLGAQTRLRSRPAISYGESAPRLGQPFADGHTTVVDRALGPGFQDRSPRTGWGPYTGFGASPTQGGGIGVALAVPSIDLDGDGRGDLLASAERGLRWHRFAGRPGWAGGEELSLPAALQALHDRTGTVQVADMTGDGLTDLVQVRPGAVTYWPNLGYGRFGPPVRMAKAPQLDSPDQFTSSRLVLADVDGTGTADLIYLGRDGARVYPNQAGNAFGPAVVWPQVPVPSALSDVAVVDLTGSGIGCLTWRGADGVTRAVELSETRPGLLASVDDGRGHRTEFTFTTSTAQYAEDLAGHVPWRATAPFGQVVLAQAREHDLVTGAMTVSDWRYRHACYDDVLREWRGFAYVERRDERRYPPDPVHADTPAAVPVRLTRTWLHSGLPAGQRPEDAMAADFYPGDPAHPSALADQVSDAYHSSGRELARALAGRPLREEVYGLDEDAASVHPCTVTEHAYLLRVEQPGAGDRPPVVACLPQQSLTRTYERAPDDPRTTHDVTVEFDEAGNRVLHARITYPRRAAGEREQAVTRVEVTTAPVLNRLGDAASYLVGLPLAERRHEIGPLAYTDTAPVTPATLAAAWRDPARADVTSETPVTSAGPALRRLLAATTNYYWDDDLATAATVGRLALAHHMEQAVCSDALLAAAYPGIDGLADLLESTGHVQAGGLWWAPGPQAGYTAGAFYAPTSERSVRDGVTSVTYDPTSTYVTAYRDPAGDTATAEYNLAALAPARITDPNGVVTTVSYDPLGAPTASTAIDPAHPDAGPDVTAEYRLTDWESGTGPPGTVVGIRVTAPHRTAEYRLEHRYLTGTGRPWDTLVQERLPSGTMPGRWASPGRHVHTVDGIGVRGYAPYFTAADALPDEADLAAITPMTRTRGDEAGRPVEVELGDGSRTRTVMQAWSTQRWDANDAVVDSRWEADHRLPLASADFHAAIDAAAAHAGTPTIGTLDASGREFLTTEDGGPAGPSTTRQALDVDGAPLLFVDPRHITTEQRVRDLLGRPVRVVSTASGTTATLYHADGLPAYTWGARGQMLRIRHDRAGRLLDRAVQLDGGVWRVAEVVSWDAPGSFGRGRIGTRYDGAGRVDYTYDYRGRPVSEARTFAADPTTPVDWTLVRGPTGDRGLLVDETLTTSTGYDGEGRPVRRGYPDGSGQRIEYDLRGLPTAVQVTVEGAESPVLASAAYDAAGRPLGLTYGNGVTDTSVYEPSTGRLRRRTTAGPHGTFRDQTYVYDAVGNVIAVHDAAAQTIFFANARVGPDRTFTYDDLYRLTIATGREAATAQPGDGLAMLAPRSIPHPADRQAVRGYRETYQYDAAGNLTSVVHESSPTGWSRRDDIDMSSDRIAVTDVDGPSSRLTYNPSGCPEALPGVGVLTWDDDERLATVDLVGGGTAYYAYDSEGQRVRTVVVRLGELRDEHVYLPGWSRYQRTSAAGGLQDEVATVSASVARPLAYVERRTRRDVAGTATWWRYQHLDQIGSVCVETGVDGNVISMEEYAPFGASTYQAAQAGLPPKRFRFRGRERDTDTGLDIYGVRYYACWLGRWLSPDPAGMADGTNRYWYVRDNPATLVDPDGTQSRPLDHLPVSCVEACGGANTVWFRDRDGFWQFANRESDSCQQATGRCLVWVNPPGPTPPTPAERADATHHQQSHDRTHSHQHATHPAPPPAQTPPATSTTPIPPTTVQPASRPPTSDDARQSDQPSTAASNGGIDSETVFKGIFLTTGMAAAGNVALAVSIACPLLGLGIGLVALGGLAWGYYVSYQHRSEEADRTGRSHAAAAAWAVADTLPGAGTLVAGYEGNFGRSAFSGEHLSRQRQNEQLGSFFGGIATLPSEVMMLGSASEIRSGLRAQREVAAAIQALEVPQPGVPSLAEQAAFRQRALQTIRNMTDELDQTWRDYLERDIEQFAENGGDRAVGPAARRVLDLLNNRALAADVLTEIWTEAETLRRRTPGLPDDGLFTQALVNVAERRGGTVANVPVGEGNPFFRWVVSGDHLLDWDVVESVDPEHGVTTHPVQDLMANRGLAGLAEPMPTTAAQFRRSLLIPGVADPYSDSAPGAAIWNRTFDADGTSTRYLNRPEVLFRIMKTLFGRGRID